MKKLLLTSAALCLLATSAFAGGLNLTVGGCPNNGTAVANGDAGTLDCATGTGVTMLVTFMPAEAIADLVGIDLIMDITVNGDVNSTANFWDFAVNNSGGLQTDHRRPAAGCTAPVYQNQWNVSSAGSAAAGAIRGPGSVRIAGQCQRPTLFVATANQRLFGIQFTVDPSTSVEQGGTGAGCSTPAGFALQHVLPASANNLPVTLLTEPDPTTAPFGQRVMFNGAALPTPADRHSWGQLKNLYR